MKKIIYLIVAIASISTCYSQTAEEYFNRGNSKTKIQDYIGAIADYSKVIELAPEYYIGYFNRGNSKASLQDFRGAIADFTKAIELEPRDPDIYYNRGVSKLSLNQIDSGCLDFSKAGELGAVEAYELIRKYCN